jgi:type III restriction enzyme
MLTEGWDANTVTHILGIRAFGTQLLCEQVVGRGLRRMSYAVNQDGKFDPEYAEVYGVPFSFIPCSGSAKEPSPGPMPTRVRALEERIACEITFPRVMGYRYELPAERLSATFSAGSKLTLSTADIPTKVQLDPIVGESSIHTLEDLKRRRGQEVAFLLSKLVLEKYFRDDQGNDKPWLFPQILNIANRWLKECVILKDNTFPQLLLLIEFAHDAADRIYRAIVSSSEGDKSLKPILKPYDTIGSTRYVDFDTTRSVYSTRPDKCHISHVVADTESWEQKMASALEEMDEVICYVKNQNLGFAILYTINGEERNYYPDFIARLKSPSYTSFPFYPAGEPPSSSPLAGEGGGEGEINLIIEVTGENRKDKVAKVSTARTLWIPAINNHGGFGRWIYLEIADPWNAQNIIREALKGEVSGI